MHLLIEVGGTALSKLMQSLQFRYTRNFNLMATWPDSAHQIKSLSGLETSFSIAGQQVLRVGPIYHSFDLSTVGIDKFPKKNGSPFIEIFIGRLDDFFHKTRKP